MNAAAWFLIGFLIILVGMFIIVAAGVYEAYRQSSQAKGQVQAGGVVMIGPIPIVFGTSWKMAIIAMVLAIVLIVISIALMLLARGMTLPRAESLAALLLRPT
ncbi:hypothetical protein ASAC_0736 [Acidilobus saccharovorans 345-15]|uniref:DUF131 domain-containing protein n=1 Tax=Acidilobus saccharovorans (strain DSM 16705 / JCM 18335 / VKM B-2471 / 345-15) TaxID=666510 RepID=D9Q1F4_ACIS3|nr:TIGR00304 family protein [Acidilobus saccharovorans]ADL19142.1 hypothetical protein ASAC_0736 [Acidilobus saccharovorans 345-15]